LAEVHVNLLGPGLEDVGLIFCSIVCMILITNILLPLPVWTWHTTVASLNQ